MLQAHGVATSIVVLEGLPEATGQRELDLLGAQVHRDALNKQWLVREEVHW